MEKYTFEDWLNDRIDYKLPGGQNIIEASNRLATLYGEKLLTKQDYEKIKNCQRTAYDRAVEIIVETKIRHFSENYKNVPDESKSEYLNNEIRITQERTDKNLTEKNHILAGYKDYKTIKGGEYQKIMKDKNFIDVATGKYSFFTYAYNDNLLIVTLYRYLQWLKEKESIQNPEAPGKQRNLSIPTKAKTTDEILFFWLKLQGNNEKGEPYWNSRQEITHFVNQNFEGFPGVDEIKEFNPNMNKSEIYQVAWTFFTRYGKYKTKRQYENLLKKNFTQFRNTKNVYSNIKYHSKDHLRRVTK